MEFRVLGPLEVFEGDRLIAVGGRRQRALLAFLLVHANQIVSSEQMIEGLWGGAPGGTNAVQVAVSRLRKALKAEDRPLTQPPGYVLRVSPGEYDRDAFESLAAEAR